MPFTPFHFGAHTCCAMPFRKYINLPVFLISNVIVDIEPLLVMVFGLKYPLHGYAHTFLGASVLGVLLGLSAYWGKDLLRSFMGWIGLPGGITLSKCVISGILGGILHVIFDAVIYTDVRPFYPFSNNPFYGSLTSAAMYKLCTLLFIPAGILFLAIRSRQKSGISDNR